MARTSTPWSLLLAQGARLRLGHHLLAPPGEWAKAGVSEQLQAIVPDALGAAGRIDLERVSVDPSSLRAVNEGT